MIVLPQRGLYAITQPEHKTLEKVVEEVTAAITGGATIIQYRDKQPMDAEKLATQLLTVCSSMKVPLIINDNIDLAAKIGADGVHLGQNDGLLVEARKKLGKEAIIGISCYSDLQKAQVAQSQGANYVAFGRFYPSRSKPLAPLADINILKQAKLHLQIPMVAIGGIKPENGAELIDAGADFLAAIDGVFAHAPEHSAKNYQQLFR